MFDVKSAAWWRRVVVMMCGIFILGLGVGMLKLTLMGNDPYSAMVMALGDTIGMPFSVILVIVQAVWFIFEIAFGRKLIGPGTFFNWFFVGIFTDFWIGVITSLVTVPETFFGRFLMLIPSILIVSLAVALYQTAKVGVSPYDAASLIMAERLPLPYFWCRIITDSLCTILTLVWGGIVGLGTLFCALGLGPFITFFTNKVARPLCGYGKESVGDE